MTRGGIFGGFIPVAPWLIGIALAAPASREDAARHALRDSEQMKARQQELGQAAAERVREAARETERLARERVAAALRLQQADAAAQAAADRIDALAARQRDADRRIEAEGAKLQPLLPLIERLSLYPAETLLALPGPPESAVRGLLVLQFLSRSAEQQAEALRRDQADSAAAAEALKQEAPRLAEAQAAQARQAAALDQQIARTHADQAKAEAEAAAAANQAALAAARADTLRAALAALDAQGKADAERRKPAEAPPTDAHADAHPNYHQNAPAGTIAGGAGPTGPLQPPVIGVVVKGWGEPTDGGPATGVTYHAPPNARVIASCGGRVVFADRFRGYGLLLIVDCGGGYHLVLAGFDRLDVTLGQRILPGEPVGVMPSWEPGSATPRPGLYVELRHDGQPVNPAPWLRTSG